MIIEINNREYNFPESWDEVTIGEFASIIDVIQDKELTDKQKEGKMASILGKIDEELLLNSSIRIVNLILSKLSFIADTQSFINYTQSENFEFQGVKYVIPDNFGQLTFSQYTNTDYFIKQANDNEEPAYKYAPQIIALFCQPEDEEYDFDKAKERFELFKELPVKTAYGIMNFFLLREENFRHLTNLFLTSKEILLAQMNELDKSIASGAGSRFVGNLLRNGLRNQRKLVERL